MTAGFLSVLTVRHALRLNKECIMLADLTDGSVLLVVFQPVVDMVQHRLLHTNSAIMFLVIAGTTERQLSICPVFSGFVSSDSGVWCIVQSK